MQLDLEESEEETSHELEQQMGEQQSTAEDEQETPQVEAEISGEKESSKTPTLPPRRLHKGARLREWEKTPILKGRTRTSSRLLEAAEREQQQQTQQQVGGDEGVVFLPSGSCSEGTGAEGEEAACALHLPLVDQPSCMEDALAGPDRDKWIASRDAEYSSQLENGT